VSNLRTLLSTTIAILACACSGAVLDTAAAGSPPHRGHHGRAHRAHHRAHKARHRSARRAHAAHHRSAHRSHAGRRSHAITETIALATPCQNTELVPTPDNLGEIGAATLCLVNQERARNGELPLQVSAQLEEAAQGHSDEMVSEDYFAHVAPSGLTPVARVQHTGYIPSPQAGYTLGENIAWGTLQLSTPSAIVASWIASPEHLANILYSPYRDTAIGVSPAAPASLAQGLTGAVYTQEFGVIVR
jgi:uncharacterized protein YkwD